MGSDGMANAVISDIITPPWVITAVDSTPAFIIPSISPAKHEQTLSLKAA